VFAHSSPAEGFPNTRLECCARAWAATHHAPDVIHERLAALLRGVLADAR